MKFFKVIVFIVFKFVGLALKVGFYLYEFGIIARLDSEDGSCQNKQFADYADGRVRNLARRRDQEQADTGDGHARRRAGGRERPQAAAAGGSKVHSDAASAEEEVLDRLYDNEWTIFVWHFANCHIVAV